MSIPLNSEQVLDREYLEIRGEILEVAASLDVIESMHEDELFSRRDLAALVASKVGGDEFVCFYHRHHHHLSVSIARG